MALYCCAGRRLCIYARRPAGGGNVTRAIDVYHGFDSPPKGGVFWPVTTNAGDQIYQQGLGTFTVVALCENPQKAWVISRISDCGLINAPGSTPPFVVYLNRFRVAEKGPRSGKESP
jgi:hypothetical protein